MQSRKYQGWGGENYESTAAAALSYYRAGLPVIPIVPNTKRTAVQWDPWLNKLSEETVQSHWDENPDHGIGFIVPEGLVVFDADTLTAVAALYLIEESFDISPSIIVTTRRGEHHYFRLVEGTKVNNRSINTAKCPQGIDIKANRSMVVLP